MEALMLQKQSQLGVSLPVYLNRRESQSFNYYNLVVVDKRHLNPEHFIVSKSGIVHVKPSGIQEHLSPREWYREATLHRALSRIPFVRTFLARKALIQWRQSIQNGRINRSTQQLNERMLMTQPLLATTALELKKLLQMLHGWKFISIDVDYCYSIDELEDVIDKSLAECKKRMSRVLFDIQHVLGKTRQKAYQWLQELEDVRRNLPLISGLPLSVEKQQRQDLEREICKARSQLMSLGRFCRCMGELVMAELTDVARETVLWFWEEVLCAKHAHEMALIQLMFIFVKTDTVALSPPPKSAVSIITSLTLRLKTLLCAMAEAADVTNVKSVALSVVDKKEVNEFGRFSPTVLERSPGCFLVQGTHISGQVVPIFEGFVRQRFDSE